MTNDWQPIETAPKDEIDCGYDGLIARRILAWDKQWDATGCAVTAYWDIDHWQVYGRDDNTIHFKPTHWMPLPAPPNNEQQEGVSMSLHERMKKYAERLYTHEEKALLSDLQATVRALEVAREALVVYSDRDNWIPTIPHGLSCIARIQEEKAQQALKAIDEIMGTDEGADKP